MAIGTETLKILEPSLVPVLHLRNLHPRVVNFNASFTICSLVRLHGIFAAALAEQPPAMFSAEFCLLGFPETCRALAAKVLPQLWGPLRPFQVNPSLPWRDGSRLSLRDDAVSGFFQNSETLGAQ